MIQGYKQEAVIDTPSQNCTIYRASKGGKQFLMHEYDSINESDQYSFKIRKKLKCSHIVGLIEEFQEGDYKYFISEYMQTDLLKLALSRPGKVLQLNQALQYFAKTLQILQQLHFNKLVYRNIRPQKIRIHNNQPYLYDFSMSQFTKRKERMFDIVGCGYFLAPEFFSEDGYGEEIDVWAAGVMLFYLLVNQYPFKAKGQEEGAFKEEFMLKCADGFKFSKQIQNTNHYIPPLKGNKNIQDFFKRLFQPNPTKRITIQDIKLHPLFEGLFPNQVDKDMLAVIQQNGRQESVFLSKMYKFPCSKILHKQQVILDFIQQTAQLFLLECTQIYPQEMRYKVQFSVLKVGLIKSNMLLAISYGMKDPFFKIDPQEWKQVRASSALNFVKDKLQRKKKILYMIFKSAYMNVNHLSQKQPFFKEDIPEFFEDVKVAYRGVLSEMFEFGRKSLSKAKGNRKLSRKLTESLVRVIILFLVNRLFQSQQSIAIDFQLYLAWSKKKDLQDLQQWIQSQELVNLKQFMKTVTTKYL